MLEQSNVHRRLERDEVRKTLAAAAQGAVLGGVAAGQCSQATDSCERQQRDDRIGPHALHLAAQAWCAPGVTHKVVDPDLCVAFASILERELRKPWLGNATTAELLDEVHSRCGSLQYATSGRR
jgi:hypothetical protein